ncbi:MAG: CBS and ACT domain-containing protein [Thermodesulfobacteriota bacterium]|nr:CBS and ACT domain-containing protein [Thermodesulfobacteriota bacterium]
MFISRSMTRKVFTLKPGDSLIHAREFMKANRIQHVPVVDPEDHVVGVITDRDLRTALPSSLYYQTGSPEERAKLERFRVEDVMTQDVILLSVRETIQDALLLILKHDIGCLPVVDEAQKLVGIVTVKDLLRSFVSVLGIGEPGTLLCIVVEDKLGQMKQIVDTIYEERISIGSVLVARHWEPGKRAVFPYVFSINVGPLKRRFKEKGYTLLDPLEWYLDVEKRNRKD